MIIQKVPASAGTFLNNKGVVGKTTNVNVLCVKRLYCRAGPCVLP